MKSKGNNLVYSLESPQINCFQERDRQSPSSIPICVKPSFQLEDHNRCMLETFKKNSGLLCKADDRFRQPKQTQSFDIVTKANSYMTEDFVNDQNQKQLINIEDVDDLQADRLSQHKNFLFQIFITLGLASRNDEDLAPEDLVEKGYLKYIEMKSNGRWQIIQKLFKTSSEQERPIKNNTSKSIIKKKIGESSRVAQKKRVKVIQPESASQLIRTKFKLAEDLQNYMQKLQAGFNFKKYCFNSEKIEQVRIYFSSDMKYIAIKRKKNEPNVSSMSNFNGITQGIKSKNFNKYLCRGYEIDQNVGFSILLKDRSLDLVAQSVDKKKQFIEGIKFARSFT